MEEDRYLRITLRIPKDVHQKLEAEAERTSKSLNAEIVTRLEASLGGAHAPVTADMLHQTINKFVRAQESKNGGLTMVRQLLAENLLGLYDGLPQNSPRRKMHEQGARIARAVTTPGAPGLEDVLDLLVPGKPGMSKFVADAVRETEIDFGPPPNVFNAGEPRVSTGEKMKPKK